MLQSSSKFLLFAAIFLVFGAADRASADSSVMSFQAWKASRIEDAKMSVERFGGERESGEGSKRKSKSEFAGGRLQAIAKAGRSDQKLQQAKLNLELAQEFTVNDYFVFYLSQFKQKESFIEAAKKLSPEEAAELMMSYQKRLQNGDVEGVSSASLSGLSSIR